MEQEKGQSLSVRGAQGSKSHVQCTMLDRLGKMKAEEDSGSGLNLGIILDNTWRNSLEKRCYFSKQLGEVTEQTTLRSCGSKK